MVEFIKCAVRKVEHSQNIELFNAITCMVMCDINTNTKRIEYASNIVTLANHIKQCCLQYHKELSECSPLDFADIYQTILGGNSIYFLRVYQDHIGPIE